MQNWQFLKYKKWKLKNEKLTKKLSNFAMRLSSKMAIIIANFEQIRWNQQKIDFICNKKK